EGVRVGEVVLQIGEVKAKKGDEGEGEGGMVKEKHDAADVTRGEMVRTTMKNSGAKLVRSYRSQVEDLTWARQGVVAT
ncbi:hypothetical protein A2U01_0097916, partial [Trifolium medium]|nr:hypothetical protein [Trifolium medium]